MIVNDEQRVTLEFIATVNRGGYRPTGREVNEWRLRPQPKPRRRGELLEAAVPAVPERRVRKVPSPLGSLVNSSVMSQFNWNNAMFEAMRPNLAGINAALLGFENVRRMAGIYAGYETIPGRAGRPARYAADKPAEKFLHHLLRLGWIERDTRKRYAVTLLGHALLRAEATADATDDDSSVVVLTAEDELAYGHVLGVVAECGEALIMDGYLDARELVHILKDSNASRFLVSNKLSRGRLTELALQIRLTPPNDGGVVRELRRTDFHDRYLIGDHKVYGLGSSLNGIGKSLTTLVEMPDAAAQIVRAEAERLWTAAEVVAWTRQHDMDESDRRVDDGRRVIRAEDSHFRHDGCDVRHRSHKAAERCSNGP